MNRRLLTLLILLLLMAQPAESASYPIAITYGRSWPLSIVVDSKRGLAYVDATSGENPPTGFSFGIINVTSHEVAKVLPLDEIPGSMALDEANGDVFVAGNYSIEVYDGANQSFAGIIEAGHPILYMTFDGSVSQNIFFTSGDEVYALNPQTRDIVGNATVNNGPEGLALDPKNGRLYVSEYMSGEIAVFQASSLDPVGTITLPACCAALMALNTDTQVLYAATGSNYVDMISARTDTFTRSVRVAPSAQNSTNEIAVDSEIGSVYVTSSPGGSILELDGSSGAVLGTFEVQSQVAGLALDTETHELFTTNYHEITVYSATRTGFFPFVLVTGGVVVAVAIVAVFLVIKWRNDTKRMRGQSEWGPHKGSPAQGGG
jgi:DNA-binding beta-propeller fold protein YncE